MIKQLQFPYSIPHFLVVITTYTALEHTGKTITKMQFQMILGKKIKIWYTVPCFSFQTRWFTIFVNSKITFWWYSQIAWPIVIDLVEVVFTSLFYHREWLKPGQGNFTGPSHKALPIWKRSFFCKIS